MIDLHSHIYIEEKALTYPITRNIVERFNARIITVKHYKDVFNRPNQNFRIQKKSAKLILAVKDGNYLYRGPDVCQNFGNTDFYYSSVLLNCMYDCDYCFLQGMYTSANIVAFVNTGDFLHAASRLPEGAYLTVSYDTDLLAFENIIPYCSAWIGFAENNKEIMIEIRTKSANFDAISNHRPVDNVILAWTLSPDNVADRYEKGTPQLTTRLKSLNSAIQCGWNVRLCFDPILKLENWKKIYGSFFQTIFSNIPADRVFDVVLGSFRCSSEYLKRIKKMRSDADILFYPFECSNGVCAYPPTLEKEMKVFAIEYVSRFIDRNRIFS